MCDSRIQSVDLSSRLSPPFFDSEQRLEMLLGFHPLRPDHLPRGVHHLLLLLRLQLRHLLEVFTRFAGVDELADDHRLRQTGQILILSKFLEKQIIILPKIRQLVNVIICQVLAITQTNNWDICILFRNVFVQPSTR